MQFFNTNFDIKKITRPKKKIKKKKILALSLKPRNASCIEENWITLTSLNEENTDLNCIIQVKSEMLSFMGTSALQKIQLIIFWGHNYWSNRTYLRTYNLFHEGIQENYNYITQVFTTHKQIFIRKFYTIGLEQKFF